MFTQFEVTTSSHGEAERPRQVSDKRQFITAVNPALVRETIRTRRRRSKIFGDKFFSDPAWDLLLVLYVAQLEQRRISISDASSSARVAMTTALRWFAALENSCLIQRRDDPFDNRRVYVELSAAGFERMTAYYDSMSIAA